MAAITLFCQPYWEARDATGAALVGAQLRVFIAGTSTPQPVYHDSGLGTPWTFPITTNADGISSGPIYLTPTPALKLVAVDSNDVPLPGYPMDHYSPAAVATA